MKYFLGIDTSNYRTSVAVCDENGAPIKNVRRLLSVKDGERGLRQSDALFAHVKALPEIMKEIGEYPLAAVGYSAYPRDCEGSYMPCFLAGKAAASAVAELMGVPLYPFSHQAGHLSAAIYSCGGAFSFKNSDTAVSGTQSVKNKTNSRFTDDGKFIAFHLSGGTTEALFYDDGKITLLGGTLDLNAGQVIDRVGVMLGLKFPAGEELEALAGELPFSKGVKTSVKGFNCNLAGVENLSKKLYDETGDKALVAAFAIDSVCKTLDKMTENILNEYPSLPVLYAGGVMACKRIKKRLSGKYDCAFAEPQYSGDNAVGTALLCRRAYLKSQSESDKNNG